MSRELTHADKRAAFQIATSALLRWYGDRLTAGATDEDEGVEEGPLARDAKTGVVKEAVS